MGELLEGETTVVTGAASGNGRAIARRFAEEGARVVVADIREEPRRAGRPTHERIVDEGGEAVFVECDVSDRDDLRTAVETAEEFGGIDVMVNNAGIIGPVETFVEMSHRDYREVMDANLDGVVHGSRIAAARMRERGAAGSIINMSSVAGISGRGGLIPYSTAKGGVRLFTYALADHLGPDGIRVNAIHPGLIETAMTREDVSIVGTEQESEYTGRIPLRRTGTPGEVADVALFLASDLARYVTAESIVVDGGLTNTD